MANEIYHRSNWGNAVNDIAWGDTYEKFDATNEMFVRSDNYENSNETDKLMAAINPKPSILLTPTAYDNGSLHSVKPVKTFGSELIDLTQGTAEQPSQWSNTTTNSVTFLSGAAGTRYFNVNSTQSTLISGKKYSLTLQISNYSGSDTLGMSTQGNVSVNARLDANGTHSEVFTSNGQSLRIFGRATNSATITLSVKEVTEADFDFTRGSSATRVNEQGLIEDVTDTDLPRIDYTDGTGSLLLEPQSTNLQLRSQEFDNPVWSPVRAVLTANDAISPDGTLNAYKLTHTSGSTGYVYDTIPTVNSGDSRLISVFAKYIDDEVFKIVTFTDSGNAVFNLLNGTVTSVSGTITDAKIKNYGNGWYRCSCKYTATTTATRNYGFYFEDTSKEGVHIWGAQVEAENNLGYNGEYATSYIPTSGSTVTRNADVCNNSGSSDLINSTEGVLYAEIAALADDLTFRGIALSDGTNDNRVLLRYRTTTNQINLLIKANGTTIVNSTKALTDITNFSKFALKYKSGDIALWIDGVEAKTHGNTFTLIGLDRLSFDDGNGSDDFYGKVKSVAVFKEALTDEELTALTT